jgi:hypothetical protein
LTLREAVQWCGGDEQLTRARGDSAAQGRVVRHDAGRGHAAGTCGRTDRAGAARWAGAGDERAAGRRHRVMDGPVTRLDAQGLADLAAACDSAPAVGRWRAKLVKVQGSRMPVVDGGRQRARARSVLALARAGRGRAPVRVRGDARGGGRREGARAGSPVRQPAVSARGARARGGLVVRGEPARVGDQAGAVRFTAGGSARGRGNERASCATWRARTRRWSLLIWPGCAPSSASSCRCGTCRSDSARHGVETRAGRCVLGAGLVRVPRGR